MIAPLASTPETEKYYGPSADPDVTMIHSAAITEQQESMTGLLYCTTFSTGVMSFKLSAIYYRVTSQHLVDIKCRGPGSSSIKSQNEILSSRIWDFL